MIKVIYGMPNCRNCKIAKEKYPKAEYKDFFGIPHDEFHFISEKAKEAGIYGAPILLNEKNEIVDYKIIIKEK